jgi:hypothetical protein
MLTLLLAGWFFLPDDGGDTFLQIVGSYKSHKQPGQIRQNSWLHLFKLKKYLILNQSQLATIYKELVLKLLICNPDICMKKNYHNDVTRHEHL